MDPLTLGLLMGGTSLASGGLNYLGSQQAAKAQSGAAQQAGILGLIAQQQAIAQQQQQQKQAVDALTQYGTQAQSSLANQQARAENLGQQYLTQGVGYQQPYMQTGTQATNQLAAMYAPGGQYGQMPTIAQIQMDPSYAWRFQQGQQATQNAIAAGLGGASVGGSALKAINDYGQNAASQEYQNAYQRFMQQAQLQTGALQNLSGQGAGAAQVASGLAGQTGANAANLYGTTGANQANLYGSTGQNIANVATGTGANAANLYGTTGQNLASTYGTTGSNLANTYTGTGQQLAGNYNQLGQNLGQGYANMGAANASAYMGPTNLMAALAGQAIQGGMTALGAGGFGGGGALSNVVGAMGNRPVPTYG